MSYTVRTTIYDFPASIPDTVASIARKLEERGFGPTVSYGVGDTGSLLGTPKSVDVHFVVNAASEDAAQSGVQQAVKDGPGGIIQSWSNWTVAFNGEVVGATASDALDVAKGAAKAVETGALGIGLGIGATLTTVALAALGIAALVYYPEIKAFAKRLGA